MSDSHEPYQTLHGSSSSHYAVGAKIGGGGEGSVHEVLDEPGLVLKLYGRDGHRSASHQARQLRDKQDKILAMLARPPKPFMGLSEHAGHSFWTWPLETVATPEGNFCGYVMPRAIGIMGEEFLQFSSGYDWRQRFLAARNLAAVVAATHESGYVIGDLNPRNLVFSIPDEVSADNPANADSQQVLPTLTDTDSFQMNGHNEGEVLFPCTVQNQEYSAPELIFATTTPARTFSQDAFLLAIINFQLLSLGAHPFSGISDDTVTQELRANIVRGRGVFSPKGLTLPRGMIDLELLPPPVLELFDGTLRKGHTVARLRASPSTWVEVVDEVLFEGLRTCGDNHRHIYSAHLSTCPWCAYAKRVGRDPFAFSPGGSSSKPRQRRHSQTPRNNTTSKMQARPEPENDGTVAKPQTAGDSGALGHPLVGLIPDDLQPSSLASRARASTPATPPLRVVEPQPENVRQPKRRPRVAKGAKGGGKTGTKGGRKKKRANKQGKRPRFDRLVLGLVAILFTAFLAAWLVSGGGRVIYQRFLEPLLANAGNQNESSETAPIPVSPSPSLATGSHSLTIRLCIDDEAPYDCGSDTRPVSGVEVWVIDPNTHLPVLLSTIPANFDPTQSIRQTSQLVSGDYTLGIDDESAREAGLARCPSSSRLINPADPVLRLTSDLEVVFVYCAGAP